MYFLVGGVLFWKTTEAYLSTENSGPFDWKSEILVYVGSISAKDLKGSVVLVLPVVDPP